MVSTAATAFSGRNKARIFACILLVLTSLGAAAADTVADPLAFAAVSNAEPGSTVTSNSQIISGIDTRVPVRVTGGLYSINGGSFTSATGNAAAGDSITLRQTASSSLQTSTTVKLSIGTPFSSYSFKVTTRSADKVPNAFSFGEVREAGLASIQTSSPATVSGIEAASPISVSGGSYSINGGDFTTAAGSVTNNAQVRARGTAASAANTSTTVRIKIGGVSGTFKIVTVKTLDTTPNAFSFAPVPDAVRDSVQTSAPATIEGINSAASVSILGGSYSINGGSFTSLSGSINNGDHINVRQTASPNYSTTTTASLNVGGISADYRVSTIAADTTPDPFSFLPTIEATPGSLQTSEPTTISGVDSAAPVSVLGGSYSINGGDFTSQAGGINNGDQIRVQQTASAGFATTTEAQLSIGGVSADYRVTTRAADTRPDDFGFAPTVDAALGSVQTSGPVVVSGIDSTAVISIAGGLYNVNGGPYTGSEGTVSAGAVVTVQILAAYSFSDTRSASLSIGGATGVFSVTTLSFTADQTVDGFQFDALDGVTENSLQRSAPVIVSGINVATPISVLGGRYQINGGEFTDQAGTVVDGDLIVAEVQASASAATSSSVTVVIGTVSAEFTVITADAITVDREPAPFSFLPAVDAAPDSTQFSLPIMVSGIDAEADIAIAGGRYSINGAAFTAALGSVNDGDSVVIELLASADYSATTTATLTIGGISADYFVTTRPADTTPEAFAFAPVINALRSSLVASAPVAITGIDAPTPIAITGGVYSINGAAFTNADGSVSNGDTVSIQVLAASAFSTTTSATISIGNIPADFRVTTAAADTTPEPFGFVPHPAAFPGLAVVSEPVTVRGITAPVTVSVSGGLYSVNAAPFLDMPGPVVDGDRVSVLATPGVNNGDVVTATLSIGGVSAPFRVTTRSSADNFPDLYQFRESRASINAEVFSEPAPIRGINVPTPISVLGGSYSINGSPFTSSGSTVRGGDLVTLRALTGSRYNTVQKVTLSVGAFSQDWTIRTDYDPTRLAGFTLVNASIYADGVVVPGSVQTTQPVVVRNPPGGPLTISIAGGRYSINGGAYTSEAGSIFNDDSVVVRFNAAPSYSTAASVTLNIGSQHSTLSVKTTLNPVAATPVAHAGCESHIYRELSPVPLRLFVCYPGGWRSSDRRSAMVHWFGGGFVTGDTSRSIDEAHYWADTQGMVGIAPDYRVNDRFGTYSYAAADDGRAALKWVQENAASLGIDPTRVVVSGSSAGGGVAFFAGLRDAPVTGNPADSPLLRPAAIVSRAGVPDTTEDGNAADYAAIARGGGFGTAISPSLHLDAAYPPVIMAHGDRDTTVAATPSVNFCTSLIRLGRICEFNSKTDVGHGLSSESNLDDIHKETRDFLTGLGLLPAQP